jgi:hypothetical protein
VPSDLLAREVVILSLEVGQYVGQVGHIPVFNPIFRTRKVAAIRKSTLEPEVSQ